MNVHFCQAFLMIIVIIIIIMTYKLHEVCKKYLQICMLSSFNTILIGNTLSLLTSQLKSKGLPS